GHPFPPVRGCRHPQAHGCRLPDRADRRRRVVPRGAHLRHHQRRVVAPLGLARRRRLHPRRAGEHR
ncbi:MAG: hypothetical protein AVDCRST_MAG88-859, partial [uncultured Thermomicrobiales bacterium]